MNNTLNETFSFGNEPNNFEYNGITGLGESDYENEDLFNSEVSNDLTSNDAYANQNIKLDDKSNQEYCPYHTSYYWQYNC